MESLETLGPALRSFFCEIQNGVADYSHSHNPPTSNPNSQLAKSSSPPTGSSFSSDSHSQIQLHFDSEAEDIEKDFNRSHYDFLNHDIILFERESDSGNSILELMDVGKLRYHRKIAVNPVESMESSSLLARRMGSSYTEVDQDRGLSYGNLSCTLKKLCMWEKKLRPFIFQSEEKLRILHEKKCRQLRRMYRKGAEN
ncbi:hypothetical protein L6164_024932 [Bauhinia variegata]|uniref:Uncharacterized protein n=1 Tax=Bauhinia variegata TaxID=167791 RepID=A0ACB9LZC2_BAUVA|nr:hypothetical protein L6164_024932 [Bauhinia variegata]